MPKFDEYLYPKLLDMFTIRNVVEQPLNTFFEGRYAETFQAIMPQFFRYLFSNFLVIYA